MELSGAQGRWFMKKQWSQKSHDTISLKTFSDTKQLLLTALNWILIATYRHLFYILIVFYLFQTMLENYTFLPFSVFLAIFWVFTYKKVPETKNKTFDEIATLFKIQNKQKWVSQWSTIIAYKDHLSRTVILKQFRHFPVWQWK